ncbi:MULTISPECIES: hypothetical protein [Prosthecochloris]|uniref:DUF697 domain-containing protein n=1 Tax=Prosthecochloris vibrioformis TaxID=1098 RepID=A0A5C4S3R2_PROVB|nr:MULTISPECIES: hypothetical protein [Prosthecochloris]ANT65488.1 hypothetical protein Ptc2401_01754 [Prosthecochloris sp. CIB 2401]TNJ38126.1 hypothetical protein FGF68_02800 [Prosthecochloris vibrioformis]
MQKKLVTLVKYGAILFGVLLLLFFINQLAAFSSLLGTMHPLLTPIAIALGFGALVLFIGLAYSVWHEPAMPRLPETESSPSSGNYIKALGARMPIHPRHPTPSPAERDARWLKENMKLLQTDAYTNIKKVATKNFFIGAFAQNTSYGTSTSMLNNLKMIWSIYQLHHGKPSLKGYISLCRMTYASLPLADFSKEELPLHIKPIIQSSFSNTLSSLLPAGNLLTPFFMNLFLAGATNTYLTCLAGTICTRYSQMLSKEDYREVIEQSRFESAFLLKEIVKECNPILSVTISKAVKNAGIESLDNIPAGGEKGGIAQDLVVHLANSLKGFMRENN